MNANNFGDRLKQYRLEHQFTQDDLAKLLRTSKQVLSRYETGQRIPKISVVYEYAERLAVEPSYFLGDRSEYCYASDLDPRITSDELALLRDYRTLGKQGKEYIAQQMEIAKKLFHGESDTALPLETAN